MNELHKKPTCVGFIMDGNRRWAKEHGLETPEGHVEGYRALQKIVAAARQAQITHVVCYAFSTENWNRDDTEVAHLMGLMTHALRELYKEIVNHHPKTNLRVLGEVGRLPQELQEEIARVAERCVADPELTIWVALSYGGRAEIVAAANRARLLGEEVTEESFSKLLWTAEMPDPDLIIRTSGEQRLSNFLLWQSAYSELFFTNTLWPDFGETEFKGILQAYAERHQRRGT